MGSSSQICALGQRASQSRHLGEKKLSPPKLLPSAGEIKFESERGARVETSCFHPSPSSRLQMEIKLSSNDLYPHGCQRCEGDKAENMICLCV